MKGGAIISAFVTAIVGAIGSLTTGLFAMTGSGETAAGIGLLTATVLGVGLARKTAGKAKSVFK